GAHKLWLSRFFRVVKPKTIIISNGLSPMGIALPGGIAAKLMEPDRRVVTLSGDGGFLMSVHELETAKRENAATVNIVFRDGGLARHFDSRGGNRNFSPCVIARDVPHEPDSPCL